MNAKDFAEHFMGGTVAILREETTKFKEFCDRIEPYLIRTPRGRTTMWEQGMTFYEYCMNGSEYKFCIYGLVYTGVRNLKEYDPKHTIQLVDWRKIIFNFTEFEDLL